MPAHHDRPGRAHAVDRFVERALAARAVDDEVVLVGELEPPPKRSAAARCAGWRAARSTSAPWSRATASSARPMLPPPITRHAARRPSRASCMPATCAVCTATAIGSTSAPSVAAARRGERHQARPVDDHLVGEPAVDEDAVEALVAVAAEVVGTSSCTGRTRRTTPAAAPPPRCRRRAPRRTRGRRPRAAPTRRGAGRSRRCRPSAPAPAPGRARTAGPPARSAPRPPRRHRSP